MKPVIRLCFLFMILPQLLFASDQYTWKNVIIGGGGFVSGIVTCPTKQNLIFARTDVGGAYRWVEETQSWKALNDWISRDEMGYLGIESIAIDPQHPNRVYMSAGLEYFATSPAILCSDDYGNTFKKSLVPFMIHGNGDGRGTGERLVVDPNDSTILFCGSRKAGLWKSKDMAKTWTKVTSFSVSTTPNNVGVIALTFDPASGIPGTSSKRIFAGVSRTSGPSLYVSEDGGDTWNPVSGIPTDKMPQHMVLTPTGYLYVTFSNGSGPYGTSTEALDKGSLLKYQISTQTWTDVTPNKTSGRAMSGISFSQTNPDILIASTTNTWWAQNWSTSGTAWGDEIYKSTNGGNTWTALFSSRKIALNRGEFIWADAKIAGQGPLSLHWATCIVLDPFNADRAFINSGNGLFMTQNLSASTSSWIFQVKGLDETVPLDMVSLPYGAPLISVIGDYDGFRHNNLDVSPSLGRHNPSIGSTSTLDFGEKNPGVVVRAGATAYYSSDNAKTWKLLPVPVTGAKDGSMAVSADGSTIAWSPNAQTVYTTTDKLTWTKATGAPSGQRIIADRVNAQKFYIIATQKLYVSTDGGKTFVAGATNAMLTQTKKYRNAPGQEGDLWVPNGSGGLYRTIWTNGIATFKKIASVTACESIGFGKAAPGQSFPAIYIWGTVGSIEGVYRSDNEGVNWVRINDSAHEFGGTGNANEVLGDPRIYGRVYMSTAGRGIVYGDLIDGPDANVIIDTEYLPTTANALQIDNKQLFTLQQGMNNQSIQIIPAIRGKYEIYSIAGSVLEQGRCDAPTDVAKGFRNGIYFLRFTSETGQSTSKKFIINR